MWYFSWILGIALAAAFAILNAMWYEFMDKKEAQTGLNDNKHGKE